MSSNLIPCKYFATNSCRFGDSCRFSHSRNTVGQAGNVFGGGRPFGTPGFGGGTQDPHALLPKTQNNLDAIVETVKKDLQEWEVGKIWPFSSYGPVGSKPSLPGLEDISVEEMRLKFLLNNRRPADLTQEMRNMQMSRLTYQQASPQVRDIIERVIVKNERITSVPAGGTPGSTWGSSALAPASSGVFGGGSPAVASVFGTPNQTQNVFGGAPSMFQQNSSGVFGAVAPTSSSIFGSTATPGFASLQKPADSVDTMDGSLTQQSTPSIFGNQQRPAGGLFSSQPNPTSPFQSQPQTSVFGSSFPQQQNLFQNQQPMPQSTNMFPTTQQPQQQTLFQTAASPLSQPQSQPSVFQTSSPFAPTNPPSMLPQQVTTTSSPGLFNLLTQPVTTPPVATQPQSIFGGAQSQPQPAWPTTTSVQSQPQPTMSAGNQNFGVLNVPSASSQEQKFVYSEESDLAMDQIEAFKADHFTLENIPIVAPPKTYCNM